MDKYQIKLHADPGSKRNQAERGIRGTTLFLEKNSIKTELVLFVLFVLFLFFVFCVLCFVFLFFGFRFLFLLLFC